MSTNTPKRMRLTRALLNRALRSCALAAALFTIAAPAAETITYTYDTAGRLTAAAFPGGKSLGYQYDNTGNLVRYTQSIIVDSDNDGLSDAWENQFFGNLARDGTGDFDNDGMSDLAEFLAGTLPGDPASALRLSRAVLHGMASTTIRWTAIPGKRYRVQFRHALGAGGWNDLPGDVVADGATAVKVDTFSAGEPERYYRVQIVP